MLRDAQRICGAPRLFVASSRLWSRIVSFDVHAVQLKIFVAPFVCCLVFGVVLVFCDIHHHAAGNICLRSFLFPRSRV